AVAPDVLRQARRRCRVLLQGEDRVAARRQSQREPSVVAECVQRASPAELTGAEMVLRLIEEGAGLHVLQEIRPEDAVALSPLRFGVPDAAEHAGLARQLLEVPARAVVPADHLDGTGELLQRGRESF